jgi:hypothetical protein
VQTIINVTNGDLGSQSAPIALPTVGLPADALIVGSTLWWSPPGAAPGFTRLVQINDIEKTTAAGETGCRIIRISDSNVVIQYGMHSFVFLDQASLLYIRNTLLIATPWTSYTTESYPTEGTITLELVIYTP